jgi:hypothetical protein
MLGAGLVYDATNKCILTAIKGLLLERIQSLAQAGRFSIHTAGQLKVTGEECPTCTRIIEECVLE